jgi:hypothetical protein
MFDAELAAIPAHPPRTGVLPGMRLGAAIPRYTLAVLIAFVVLFTAFPLAIMSTDPKLRLGIGPDQIVQGRVLATTNVSGCRGSGARRIVYAFSASGSEFRGVGRVCEESPYYSMQAGDRIEIRYLTRDPAVNSMTGTESDGEPPIFVFLVFPLFFILLLSPLFFPQIREVMYARRLYRTGVLTQGQVVFVRKSHTGNWPGWPGSASADIYVAHGSRAETVVRCTNDWLLNQLSPGSPVHILIPPDQSKRGVLLEAFIR